MEKTTHTFIPEMECAKEDAVFVLDEKGLLLDLKVLIKKYYAATFTENENAILLKFKNGQVFCLTVKEVK